MEATQAKVLQPLLKKYRFKQSQPIQVNQTGYLPSLDGFRALAILFVFVAHIGFERIIPGGFDVTLFFFLSGFLITRLLIHEHDKTNSLDLKGFYIRRLLRLYPPLLFMLLAVLPVVVACFQFPVSATEISAIALYWQNYNLVYLLHNGGGYINVFWSLAVEEHFYLIFPLLFLGLYKTKAFHLVIVGLIVLAVLNRMYYLKTWPAGESFLPTYVLTHCRYDSILFGCFASLIIHTKNSLYDQLLKSKIFFTVAVLLLIFTFLYRNEFFRSSFRYSIQGISLMLIVPSIVLYSKYEKLKRLLSNKWLVYIGKLSYSIYVMHMIAIFIADKLYPSKDLQVFFKPLQWYLIVFSGTILLSLISYHIVERKFISLRQKFGSVAK